MWFDRGIPGRLRLLLRVRPTGPSITSENANLKNVSTIRTRRKFCISSDSKKISNVFAVDVAKEGGEVTELESSKPQFGVWFQLPFHLSGERHLFVNLRTGLNQGPSPEAGRLERAFDFTGKVPNESRKIFLINFIDPSTPPPKRSLDVVIILVT